MKKLFLFYMLTASTVYYVQAHDDQDDKNFLIEDHLRSETTDTNHTVDAHSEQKDGDFALENIANEFAGVLITRNPPTCIDYARVALRAWYLYCIQKPYTFCKTNLLKLGAYFKKRTRHGI